MKIAMIGSRGLRSNYGGIEKVLDEICPRLAERGHEVDVYSRADISFESDNLRAIPVRSLGSKHLENLSRSTLATLRSVARYDVIHFHAIGPGVLSLLTTALRQKSVVTIHGLDWRRAKWSRFAKLCLRLAERTLVASAGGITVVSRSLERRFRSRYGIAPLFVPNGTSRKEPRPFGTFARSLGLEQNGYLLFASRLVPEKGCHDLIEAFNRLGTGKKLVIAGAGGDEGYVKALRLMADPGRVVFAGHRTGDELAELFSNACLFVLPSYVEGMSNALLEALAYDRAVLVSDIEENAEVIDDTGFTFRTGDVADLRLQLGRLLDRPAEPGNAARPRPARQLSWDEVTGCYDQFYREIVGRP